MDIAPSNPNAIITHGRCSFRGDLGNRDALAWHDDRGAEVIEDR